MYIFSADTRWSYSFGTVRIPFIVIIIFRLDIHKTTTQWLITIDGVRVDLCMLNICWCHADTTFSAWACLWELFRLLCCYHHFFWLIAAVWTLYQHIKCLSWQLKNVKCFCWTPAALHGWFLVLGRVNCCKITQRNFKCLDALTTELLQLVRVVGFV